jgi:hypothetical protein
LRGLSRLCASVEATLGFLIARSVGVTSTSKWIIKIVNHIANTAIDKTSDFIGAAWKA